MKRRSQGAVISQTDQAAIQHEIDRYARFFDTIERSPLTREQRIAAVTMAKRNVLIAAAGSGKTSTMVAKVAYAIRSGLHTPDQILVLAFNRKAAVELDVRLRRSLAPFVPTGVGVTARTLHALGLDIVTQVKGHRPGVATGHADVLNQVLARLVHTDPDFAERWLLFRVFYHVPIRHPDQFASRKQWKEFVLQHGERRNKRIGFVSLRDELVQTQFEQAVANWLYLHDIDYDYRPLGPWDHLNTWLGGLRMRPLSGRVGFFLTTLNRYIVCLSTTSPPARHSQQIISLDINDFRAGTLFTSLQEKVGLPGRALKPGRMAKVLLRFGHRLTAGQTEFLARFIRIARLGGLEPDALMARAWRSPDPTRTALLAPMLAQLLAAYNGALDDADTIDFEGMLHRAADYLDDRRYTHTYTLVLVDEFQDTSQAGLRLLKSLLAQNSDCALFAVGDDWQSIYRFAGALPDVLTRFEQHFGASAINHLTATFRFNQSIADVASRFIQANPAQLRKCVQARRAEPGASILLSRYTTIPHMYALCKMCLNDIVTLASSPDGQSELKMPISVYILGRYQHQKPMDLDRWQQRFTQLDIRYQTVHSAKGLEADVVIVLGLHAGRHGFPADVSDDALITLVMPEPERFPYAEERRLFYVAITRSRRRVYLLAGLQEPSPFITELMGLVPTETDIGTEAASMPHVPWLQRLC